MDLCTVFENHPKTRSAIGCLIDHETIKDIEVVFKNDFIHNFSIIIIATMSKKIAYWPL